MPISFAALVSRSDENANDDLSDLYRSLQRDGRVFPMIVTPLGSGRFRIADGNRRYHAMWALMQDDASVWDGNSFEQASRAFSVIDCIVR
jgi:hypothetical protein